jgi:hypothetical protein
MKQILHRKLVKKKKNKKINLKGGTYWARDEEAREKVEEGVECGSKYCSNLMIGRYRDSHHTIVGEVEE